MFNVAHAYNFIDIGTGAATTTLNYAGGLFSDFSPLTYMIVGVLIFGSLLTILIVSFRHK